MNARRCTPSRPQARPHTTLNRNLLPLLPLNLEREIEVRLVELVHAHISVLSAGCVALAGRVHGDGVERAEMPTDAADLLLEDLVVEARLELSLARRGRRDVHGRLATAEDDKVFLWRDGGGVQGRVSYEGLHDLEVGGVDNLG